MSEKIIPFDNRERLLNKVRSYLTDLDELTRDGQQGMELLLKAFQVADEELKIKVVILLGTINRPNAVWPLLDIMRDSLQSENIRQAASIQISVLGAMLDDTEGLAEQLLQDLESDKPFDRANAAFALGWEGNLRAAPELIDCLSDEDIDVQQAAVNALSNLRDDSLFSMLAQRLQKGAKEQQRSILYNLGHFPSRHGEAARICKTFLHHNDADLRYDALVVLHGLSDTTRELALYEHCLDDTDVRIRELALKRLRVLDRSHLSGILPKIRHMVGDPDPRVRQAATRLVHQVESISLAGDVSGQSPDHRRSPK